MSEGNLSNEMPTEILGRRVLGVCPDCDGEGLLWDCDEGVTTHWAERCKNCNCIGYILDMPLDQPNESDLEEAPF